MTARPLRLATYNVEWFNALFDDAGRMLEDREPSTRYKTTRGEQLGALGIVFTAMDADGIMIIEAPDTNGRRSTVKALENFARATGLRARKAIIGFPSETEQEIAFLYDPDRLTARHDPQGHPATSHGSHDAPRFDTIFRYDLDADNISETIRFSKPPLELALATRGGTRLRLIGVHAKSKNPYGAVGREERGNRRVQRIADDGAALLRQECRLIDARLPVTDKDHRVERGHLWHQRQAKLALMHPGDEWHLRGFGDMGNQPIRPTANIDKGIIGRVRAL